MPANNNQFNLSWLIKLRWSSIAGQVATIAGTQWIVGIALPVWSLFGIVSIELLSNVLCVLWYRRQRPVPEWQLACIMVLDVTLLTGLLYFTGGPFNPFSFLYLVQIALAAVVLHAHWTWMLVLLSFSCFGLLIVYHQQLAIETLGIYQTGMWVALGVAAAFIVHFLLRITGALVQRERELGEARNLAARREKLASLATMAAGAAHELATPLGTIAVVAKELERQLTADGGRILEDVVLIRQQAGRCRAILDQMAFGAAESAGENLERVRVTELIELALAGVRKAPAVHIQASLGCGETLLQLPRRAVAQALRSIVTNAQDASVKNQHVTLTIEKRGDEVQFEVRDRGHGMNNATLARIGEPFFTTKEPGQGMGLGLFLTRAVLDQLGSSLSVESTKHVGTRVGFTLPIVPIPTPLSHSQTQYANFPPDHAPPLDLTR